MTIPSPTTRSIITVSTESVYIYTAIVMKLSKIRYSIMMFMGYFSGTTAMRLRFMIIWFMIIIIAGFI